MGSLIALLVGLTFGWVFFRRYPNNPPTSVGQVRHQLLRWIEDSPEDWLVVDPADCVQLSNPQAERLLHRDHAQLPSSFWAEPGSFGALESRAASKGGDAARCDARVLRRSLLSH